MRDQVAGEYGMPLSHVDGGIRTAFSMYTNPNTSETNTENERAWAEAERAEARAKYGPIASWDTSDVTDMNFLLAYCSASPNVSYWGECVLERVYPSTLTATQPRRAERAQHGLYV